MKKTLLLLLMLACAGAVFAQAKKTTANAAEIKTIDAYVKKIDGYLKIHKSPNLVFADTSSQTSSRAKWKKFASEKALDKFREKSETYEICYVWQQSGQITVTSTTLFSGSGDWVNYVYHYFRADGTLAKVESDYRTFYGDFIIDENVYYDIAGKQLKKNTRYRDLKTEKFKKPDPEYLKANSGVAKFDTYKTVKKLPFAHLLPGGPKKK